MSTFDGNIIIGTSVDVGGINTGLNRISAAFRKLTGSVGNNPLMRFFNEATEAASDLVEVQNIVDVTFENLAFKAERFANVAIKQFGMSRLSAEETAGSFMAMGRSMDLDSETASNMAIQLAALSADFASFYNMRQEYARVALSAVYTGETETLKRYGIVLTEANLQQFAMTKGIDANVKKMSARDKLLLRYMYIMENLDFIQGDFVRTQDSWANQTRQLEQNWKELLIILGNGITTVLAPLLGAINEVIFAMQRFMKIILIIVGNIYGINFDSMSDNMDSYADSVNDAVTEEEDLADAMKGTGKAAKKLLSPLDELNILQESSGGSGGTTDLFGDFEIPDISTDWIGEIEEDLSSLINTMYDFGRFLSDTFENLLKKIPWEKVFDVARKIGLDVSDFLNGIFSPSMFASLARTIANGLNTVIYTIQEFAHNLDWSQIGDSFGAFVNNFFRTFDWNSFADTINTLVKGFWELVGSLIEKTDWGLIKDSIGNFLKQIDWEVWASAVGIGLVKLLTSKVVFTYLKEKILELFTKLFSAEVLGAMFTAIIPKLFIKLGSLILAGLMTLFTKLGGTIGGTALAETVGLGLQASIEAALSELSFGEAVKVFFSTVKTLISQIIPLLGDAGLTGLLTTLASAFSIIGGVLLTFISYIGMLIDGFDWLKEALMVVGIALAVVGLIISGMSVWPAIIVGAISAAVLTVGALVRDVIVKNWDSIKDFVVTVISWVEENLVAPLMEIISNIIDVVSKIFDGIRIIIEAVVIVVGEYFNDLWQKGVQIITNFINLVYKYWSEGVSIIKSAVAVIVNVIEMFKNFALKVILDIWEYFKPYVEAIWSKIKEVILDIKLSISDAILAIKETVKPIISWFTEKVINPLVDAWQRGVDLISNAFSKLWDDIKSGAVASLNAVIGLAEGLINGIIDSLNGLIGGFNALVQWAAPIAGEKWEDFTLLNKIHLTRLSVPALAQGAVIPPNSPFLAMLGDQKSGTNIEAPLSTIQDAVSNVLAPYLETLISATRDVEDAVNRKDLTIGDRQIAESNNRGQRMIGATILR